MAQDLERLKTQLETLSGGTRNSEIDTINSSFNTSAEMPRKNEEYSALGANFDASVGACVHVNEGLSGPENAHQRDGSACNGSLVGVNGSNSEVDLNGNSGNFSRQNSTRAAGVQMSVEDEVRVCVCVVCMCVCMYVYMYVCE